MLSSGVPAFVKWANVVRERIQRYVLSGNTFSTHVGNEEYCDHFRPLNDDVHSLRLKEYQWRQTVTHCWYSHSKLKLRRWGSTDSQFFQNCFNKLDSNYGGNHSATSQGNVQNLLTCTRLATRARHCVFMRTTQFRTDNFVAFGNTVIAVAHGAILHRWRPLRSVIVVLCAVETFRNRWLIIVVL